MARAIPIFRIFDYQKTLEFYVSYLGFIIDWEHRQENSPVYMQITLNGIVLHLSEHHGDCSPGARIHIENFENLEEFHSMLTAKNYKFQLPGLDTFPYIENTWCLAATDPFGNRLTFTGPK